MAITEFPPIQQRLMKFIRQRFQPGYNHYNVSKLVGDASSRQYYRYVTDSGATFILAAYPEAFDPARFSYREIYDLLQAIDVPVPEIVEMDGPLGIVLQEDLGNEPLQKALIRAEPKQKKLLLQNAVDHIIAIQQKGTAVFKPDYIGYGQSFDLEKLQWEFRFFRKHYLGNYRGLELTNEEGLDREFKRISSELASYPKLLCHRDFHVRNMMMKNGILYVIDFQDARWGPPAYDLASLLKDSLELDLDTVQELIEYYLRKMSRRTLTTVPAEYFNSDRFRRQFHLMCIQRLLKALGTFGYQIIVRENFIYEQYMAGSLHRTLIALHEVSEFPQIQAMVENELETR